MIPVLTNTGKILLELGDDINTLFYKLAGNYYVDVNNRRIICDILYIVIGCLSTIPKILDILFIRTIFKYTKVSKLTLFSFFIFLLFPSLFFNKQI